MSFPRIAYVMSRFPTITETFILREIVCLVRGGWTLALYPLILQRHEIVHAEAASLLPNARRLPFLSARVAAENLRAAVEQPWNYVTTLLIALCKNLRSPRFLVRTIVLLPKIVYAARLMKVDHIQYLHAHFATHPALAAWVIRRLTGIPYGVTIHGHDLHVNRTMLATKLRDAEFVVTISDYNRRYLREVVGEWAFEKTRVIRCGVSRPRERKVASIWRRGQRLEILSIGSLQPHKGFPILLAACARLRAEGTTFRCRIIGEGRQRRLLERQIEVLRLGDAVLLLGPRTQNEVEALLASAHCYVQQSIWLPSGKGEGLPVALIEALAARLPVIASAIAGIPELVRDGETGWLVAPNDPVAIADAIHEIVGNPAEALRRAARGRALVCRDYDLEENVGRLALAIREAHEERRRASQSSISEAAE
jgi:colanic acid/amylovoran biosynthesis glycosyltransferase